MVGAALTGSGFLVLLWKEQLSWLVLLWEEQTAWFCFGRSTLLGTGPFLGRSSLLVTLVLDRFLQLLLQFHYLFLLLPATDASSSHGKGSNRLLSSGNPRRRFGSRIDVHTSIGDECSPNITNLAILSLAITGINYETMWRLGQLGRLGQGGSLLDVFVWVIEVWIKHLER